MVMVPPRIESTWCNVPRRARGCHAFRRRRRRPVDGPVARRVCPAVEGRGAIDRAAPLPTYDSGDRERHRHPVHEVRHPVPCVRDETQRYVLTRGERQLDVRDLAGPERGNATRRRDRRLQKREESTDRRAEALDRREEELRGRESDLGNRRNHRGNRRTIQY